MYIAFPISTKLRDNLEQLFPYQFSDKIGHHVTYEFGVSKHVKLPPDAVIRVCAHLTDGDSLECFLVTVDGYRTDGNNGNQRYYHITWSLDRDKGRKPVDSNKLIKEYMDAPVGSTNITFTRIKASLNLGEQIKAELYK